MAWKLGWKKRRKNNIDEPFGAPIGIIKLGPALAYPVVCLPMLEPCRPHPRTLAAVEHRRTLDGRKSSLRPAPFPDFADITPELTPARVGALDSSPPHVAERTTTRV